MPKVRIIVEVELEHKAGLFASNEDLHQKIIDAVDAANPEQVEGGSGGEYDVTNWEASVFELENINARR